MQEKYKCCLCGQVCYGYGNNPFPLKERGRCCDVCNLKVIQARLGQMGVNIELKALEKIEEKANELRKNEKVR